MYLVAPQFFPADAPEQALSLALLSELLRLLAGFLLVSAVLMLVIYLVGLARLCWDEERAARARRRPVKPRAVNSSTPQSRVLRFRLLPKRRVVAEPQRKKSG